MGRRGRETVVTFLIKPPPPTTPHPLCCSESHQQSRQRLAFQKRCLEISIYVLLVGKSRVMTRRVQLRSGGGGGGGFNDLTRAFRNILSCANEEQNHKACNVKLKTCPMIISGNESSEPPNPPTVAPALSSSSRLINFVHCHKLSGRFPVQQLVQPHRAAAGLWVWDELRCTERTPTFSAGSLCSWPRGGSRCHPSKQESTLRGVIPAGATFYTDDPVVSPMMVTGEFRSETVLRSTALQLFFWKLLEFTFIISCASQT